MIRASTYFTADLENAPFSHLSCPPQYLEDLAMGAVSSESFKIALFCLIIETAKYFRDR